MDFSKSPNINYLWSSLLVEELVRCGVDYFCIAPGSRSAPLAVAAARHSKAKCFVHYDERGLAFHAVGFASVRKKPAVLICTSGTAGANFYPAVIEASKKKVPLIVLTADRPPELRFTGAHQTIDQVGLFGTFVKFHMDLPCPDRLIAPEMVLTTVDQAVYQAMNHSPGVVHLNCMFREPLAPTAVGEKFGSYIQKLEDWSKGDQPFTTYCNAEGSSIVDLEKSIVSRLEKVRNGLIVVGKVDGHVQQKAVLALAAHLGWPVFADSASGLRLGQTDKHVITYFDQILLSPKSVAKLSFDGVVHLGGRMTSKRYYEFVAGLPLKEYMMVLNHPLRNDPAHQISLRVKAPVGALCEALLKQLRPRKTSQAASLLLNANRLTDQVMEEFFASDDQKLTEPRVARLISQHIPQDSVLFLANSMPIRDVEFYADFKGSAVDVFGNRGASGIDGLVASACGVSRGKDRPVTILIGDLALLHDLNSLSMLKALSQPMVIVAVNNNGGGIFSFLPIAQQDDVFEKCFGTPHGLSFEAAAVLFGLSYVQPDSPQEFIKAYRAAFEGRRATLIEVTTSRSHNLAVHKILQDKIKSAVELSFAQ
ncbi:MAG: 2-succinyl-5-enolpyruvyl-6-hydroxy-3-cyclohexene-1-carboxylic-acid synthase [Candidatus Omnitrophica bacterium]|nr:2-succinyl-5-enolpyruvyl-6-hydroxy-3-cyclohexene-1-carboxylic-acid synthase [Candidatus Omnitrophota bacterium]